MDHFAILRHGKLKAFTVGVALAHNHRNADSHHGQAAEEQPNIDKTLSHLNSGFDVNAKSKVFGSIPNKRRKDAVVCVEVLLTASPDFFDSIETDRTALSSHPQFLKWCEKSREWAEKEFGKNLIECTLHMDETTPHFHALTVPMIGERLCAKEVTARKEMQRRQDDYADAMRGFGLKRGKPATETKRKHVGLKDTIGGADRKRINELERLEPDVARLQSQVDDLQKRLNKLDGAHKKLQKLSAGMLKELTELKADINTKTEELERVKMESVTREEHFKQLAEKYQQHKAEGGKGEDFDPGETPRFLPDTKSRLEIKTEILDKCPGLFESAVNKLVKRISCGETTLEKWMVEQGLAQTIATEPAPTPNPAPSLQTKPTLSRTQGTKGRC